MALVTRCSSCGTTYKIYPEQLQMQNGFVRCGECRAVFNGFATLVTVEETEIEYPSIPKLQNVQPVAPDPSVKEVARSALLDDEKQYEVLGPLENKSDHTDIVGDETVWHPMPLKPAEVAVFESVASSAIEPSSDFLSNEKQPRTREYWAWLAGSVGLFLLLIVQGVYTFSADLVKSSPQSRSILASFCMPLGCSLPLPENIQLLSIVHSELEVREPEHYPEVLTLTTIFRNHANYTQALPYLRLSLTGKDDQLLASRILSTSEYLSAAQKDIKNIKYGQELVIQLHIDNSELKSTGYRVELLYL